MEEPKVVPPVVDDESALDKELEGNIAAIKAGKESPAPAPVPAPVIEPKVKVEEKIADPATPAPEVKAEDPSNPPVAEVKEPAYEFRIPNKGKFESDESYEKRIELLDLVKRKKLATTPEQKQRLSTEIQTATSQLKTLNGSDKITNPPNKGVVEAPVIEEDPTLKADRERLKALGGATKEDVQELVRQERIAQETKSTLDTFVKRHPELADKDTRDVFFEFVESNYVWAGKGGKDLMTTLELAREAMFRPSETIQERVLKGANVSEKINAMQFPGGSVARTDYSPEMRKDINELVATGMTEEKAVALLTE